MSFSGMTSFWSRSFEEYRLILGLTESDLAGPPGQTTKTAGARPLHSEGTVREAAV